MERLHILMLAALALLLTAPAGAQQGTPPTTATASEVREFEHAPSPAIGGEVLYSLYLPPGYEASGRRYPTLYLLHGKDGNHLEWLKTGYLQQTLDGLIAARKVAPMIVVMPDGAAASWYVDSKAIGGPGDYATAISVDLVDAIDKEFRTRAEPHYRAIGGLSMGGYGALRLAFRQPFEFGAVVAFSPALWAHLTPDTQLDEARANRVFDGSFGRPFSSKLFLSESPLTMVDRLATAKGPPPVFLTVGDQDRFKLYLDTFELFRRMREKGLTVEMRMTGGDHDWDTWAAELPDALLFLDAQFKRGDAAASR
ncbi:MAG TPA: alpha/beta hydrolase family protein [Stellaceae bacterium]|nr:alpha/beta hydrolase family protein [Stellaceae bacterium]